MRKRIFGRRLKRDTNERKALFKSLSSSVILHERIETTEEKAKAVRGTLEKLITKAKKEGKKAESALSGYLNAEALAKLIADVAPRFTKRPGGYTRIIRLGKRVTDSSSMVYLELTEVSKAVAIAPKVSKEKVEVSKEEKKPAKKSLQKKETKTKPAKK